MAADLPPLVRVPILAAAYRPRLPILPMVVATVAFGVAFGVWTLLAGAGAEWTGLDRGSVRYGLLIAAAVVVGTVGRLPVGLLTDRYGTRVVLPAVGAVAAVLLAVVAFTGSVLALVGAGAVGGTMFAAGAAVVASCQPMRRRGLALGVFGIGVAGAAVAGLTGPYAGADRRTVCSAVAVALLVVAAVAAVVLPGAVPSAAARPGLLPAAVATLRLPLVARLAGLYAVGFGTLVAMSLYLPVYLHAEYGLDWRPAALLTAGFVATAAACRPIGGMLADRQAALPGLAGGFAAAAVGAAGQAFAPPLPVAVLALAGVAAGLGLASGALLALTGILAPPERAGSVIGAVGAVGGLGALVPPLLVTGEYVVAGSFGVGLALLATGLAAAAGYVGTRPVEAGAALPGPRGAVWLLDETFDQASASDVRRAVQACATANGLQDRPAMKFVLAVHELMVNAVRHGGGWGRLRVWRADGELWCWITDAGPGIPRRYRDCRRHPRPDDPLGAASGLWLTAQMCAEVRIGAGPLGGASVLLRYPMPTEPAESAPEPGG